MPRPFQVFTNRNPFLWFFSSLQDNVKTSEELTRLLDSTRKHLGSQLNHAEIEKAHLTAQIQV